VIIQPLKKVFLVLLCSTPSAFVLADYDTLFVDAAQGEAISQFRLGFGETPKGEEGEKVTSMFYLSYFGSEDTVKVESDNLGSQKVEILAIGAGGFGYLENPNEDGGAEFDFEISNTKFDLTDYDRTGLGFRTQLFVPIAAGLQANIGFNLRPFFLASDWDDQSDLEVEYQGGLEYAFNWDVALYAHYRKLEIHAGDIKTSLTEDVVFGFRARF